MKRSRFLISLCLIALIAGGIHLYFRYQVAPSFLLPEIKMTDLEGIPVVHTHGQNTILLFFGTWCRDCRKELPMLTLLEQQIIEKDIRVILVSDEDPSKLKEFGKTLPSRFSLLHLTKKFSENGIYTLPTSYLYCADGSIFLKKTGAIEWTETLLNDFVSDCPQK